MKSKIVQMRILCNLIQKLVFSLFACRSSFFPLVVIFLCSNVGLPNLMVYYQLALLNPWMPHCLRCHSFSPAFISKVILKTPFSFYERVLRFPLLSFAISPKQKSVPYHFILTAYRRRYNYRNSNINYINNNQTYLLTI